MKYLRSFLENNNDKLFLYQSDIDDIMDVFQDLIDEYNLEKYHDTDEDHGMNYDILFYKHSDAKKYSKESLPKVTQTELRIYFPFKDGMTLSIDNLPKLSKDVDDFITRVKSMGYSVNKENYYTFEDSYDYDDEEYSARVHGLRDIPKKNNKHIYCIGIKITSLERSKQLHRQLITGQIKSIRENKNIDFTPEEIDDIKDIFQDLVDEYDMIKTTAHGPTDSNFPISYRILIPQNLPISIRIYTPNKNGKIVPFENETKLYKSINEFVMRLQAMGYTVDKSYLYEDDKSEFLDFIRIKIQKCNLKINETRKFKLPKVAKPKNKRYQHKQELPATFTQDELEDISDIFRDIADEFNLQKIDPHKAAGLGSKEKVYFLHMDKDFTKIHIYIENCDRILKMTKNIEEFNSRLKAMGYNSHDKFPGDNNDVIKILVITK